MDPVLVVQQLESSSQKYGGRSGSFFVFTPDREFIVKTLPQTEAETLHKMLPHYVSVSRIYISYCDHTVFFILQKLFACTILWPVLCSFAWTQTSFWSSYGKHVLWLKANS